MGNSAVLKRHNENEPENVRKEEAVEIVRWIPTLPNHFAAIFSDKSLYIYNNSYVNSISMNSKDASINIRENYKTREVILEMRQIEKTNKIRNHFASNSPEEIPLQNSKNVKFKVDIQDNIISDFCVATNSAKVNPENIWQFYYKKINDIKFAPKKINKETVFAIAASDPYLRIFRLQPPSLKVAFRSFYGHPLCLDFSHDSNLLACGFQDDSISIYDMKQQQVLCRCNGHKSFISALRFDHEFFKINNNNLPLESDDEDEEKVIQPVNKAQPKKFKTYKKITGNDILNSFKSNERSELPNETTIYRLISAGFDSHVLFWNIEKAQLRRESIFIKRKQTMELEGRVKSQSTQNKSPHHKFFTATYTTHPLLKSYPQKIHTILPVANHKEHDFPIMLMEVINSYILTLSQRQYLKVLKPELKFQEENPSTGSSFEMPAESIEEEAKDQHSIRKNYSQPNDLAKISQDQTPDSDHTSDSSPHTFLISQDNSSPQRDAHSQSSSELKQSNLAQFSHGKSSAHNSKHSNHSKSQNSRHSSHSNKSREGKLSHHKNQRILSALIGDPDSKHGKPHGRKSHNSQVRVNSQGDNPKKEEKLSPLRKIQSVPMINHQTYKPEIKYENNRMNPKKQTCEPVPEVEEEEKEVGSLKNQNEPSLLPHKNLRISDPEDMLEFESEGNMTPMQDAGIFKNQPYISPKKNLKNLLPTTETKKKVENKSTLRTNTDPNVQFKHVHRENPAQTQNRSSTNVSSFKTSGNYILVDKSVEDQHPTVSKTIFITI